MFTVSHATAAGAVEFEGFDVDSDPEVDPPEEPLEPLTCLGPLSDEFDGAALAPKWSVRQATGTPITVADGALKLPVTMGDINEGNTGPISFVGQDAPTGAWEASAKISLTHASHWQYAGLLVHKSDDEYNKFALVRNNSGNRFFEFQTETGGSRTTHGTLTVPADFPTTAYLKLVSDGTSLTAHYSTNGESWTRLTGTAPLKTDAEIGLVGAGDEGTTARVASVDWFHLTPDRQVPVFEADDEFAGTSLDGCRWAKSVRYDSNHVEVTGGELKVTTQLGDINGNNPVSPRNFILQAPPAGDWVASTRFKAPLKHRWQLAGLLMYGDDNNYVKADVVAYNNPGAALDLRAELAAENNAAGAGSRQIDIADSSESGYWYLRVTKVGSTYTAEVSDGGINWTPIGATGVTFDKPLTGLGLMAIGPEQEEETTVGFDYFHLGTGGGEPDDTTAPTTTITFDPAAPDGQGGWYTSAPSFTLAATDGDGSGVAGTEYRIGAGAWTAYAGAPVTLAGVADGTVAVEFRSTDVAGNVEEVGSSSVKLDLVAPTTGVTLDPAAPNGQGGWYTSAPSFTLAAADAGGSGVAGTEYRIGGGAWTAYAGTPVALTDAADGTVTIDYRSTDVAGNVATDGSTSVDLDRAAPTTEASVAASGDAKVVTLTATDPASGVTGTEVKIGEGAWAAYTGPVSLNQPGLHVVSFRSTDLAGLVETVKTVEVTVDEPEPGDTAAPTTGLTTVPAAPNGSGGWFTSAPSFVLSADDHGGSGVASTEYRIGSGPWTAYAGSEVSLASAADGTVTIEFRSTDVAGNVADAASASVLLDRVAPETSAATASSASGSQVVTLTATDATSGVAGTEVNLDNGPWSAYTGPVTVSAPGAHVVSYRSTDRAGLVEATRSVSVTVADGPAPRAAGGPGEVDEVGPSIVVSGLQNGAVYGHSKRVDLDWTVTPTGDAVQRFAARLDGRTVAEGRLDLSTLALGRHTLQVAAIDTAGNSTMVTIRFTVATSYQDLKRLVKRFAADGSMSATVRDRLLAGIGRAQDLADSRPAQAAAQLKEVRRDAARISDRPHRKVVKKDAAALIRDLR